MGAASNMRRKCTCMGVPGARGRVVQGSFVIDLVLSDAFTLSVSDEGFKGPRFSKR